MGLRALVLCSDDKILRVLRRVLSDLDIDAEHCTGADAAVKKLTRQRFEAVVVDCEPAHTAASVLKSVRLAPCNQHAIGVALLGGATAVRSAFTMGAHFVLYKPISAERARSSFRAIRALMKCERRRNTRVSIELPVTLSFASGEQSQLTTSMDLSEGGMAARCKRRARVKGPMSVRFALPGDERPIGCGAEMAWEDDSARAGIRFIEMESEDRARLRTWLAAHAPDLEGDDPPVAAKLTDLSPGGCYVEIATPFPVRTRVTLAMRNGDVGVKIEGIVRVAHPENGMGVEFVQSTGAQRQNLERFIHTLIESRQAAPELEVQPEGIEDALPPNLAAHEHGHDPLLDLFHQRHHLSAEDFLGELRQQRRQAAAAASEA